MHLGKWSIDRSNLVLGVSGLMTLAGFALGGLTGGLPTPWQWLIFGIPYLLCGYPVLRTMFANLAQGDYFDEFTLMGAATLAAIALGELPEAVSVMLFYRVGEEVQERAADSSRRSIQQLLASKPDVANVMDAGGHTTPTKVEDVPIGAILRVVAGEKIPIDSHVVSGTAHIDTSSITGEPVPVQTAPGEKLLSGMIVLDGSLTLETETLYADSSIARILELVEHALEKKSPTERFITRFARWYTPAMFAVAMGVAFLPPILGMGSFHDWIYRGLVILMISCPCALVLSIPLGYFGGIGAASRRGILVKGSAVLDALKDVRTAAFDKTGTLTRGVFEVTGLHPAPGVTAEELLSAAMICEAHSTHPIARSILQGAKAKIKDADALLARSRGRGESREISGMGVVATLDGTEYAAGNTRLMRHLGIEAEEDTEEETRVHVAADGKFLGVIAVSDVVRSDAQETVTRLQKKGFRCLLLSGDREAVVSRLAKTLGLDAYRSQLLPQEKVQALEDLSNGGTGASLYIGDGLNDAPLLAASKVSFAMGAIGSQAAIEVADVVIAGDSPSRVPDLIDIADNTRRIVQQNIALALSVKGVFLVLAIAGLSGLWEAVFADVGVAVLAVLNASRAGKI